jgi:DnaJ like chaperone protein
MNYWGKLLGGVAGFAMGGPVGALFGAALGHAADEGVTSGVVWRLGNALPFDAARIAAMLGQREQLFAIGVTVLAAKLAKCDGPVNRAEIAAFRQAFAVAEGNVAEVGRIFDAARTTTDGFQAYAAQLGQAYADNRGALEQVLAGLYHIARADGPINGSEADFLGQVARNFGLNEDTAQRAGRGQVSGPPREDPYAVLGVARGASLEAVRARWMVLVRQNHPDSLASRGETPERVAAASQQVARINAAYDVIKRDLSA